MKRFITYLFAYENGGKNKNIGFVKTDIRNDMGRMEIHIQNLLRFQGKARVFLLLKEQEILGIELGTVIMTQGKGVASFSFCADSILDSTYPFEHAIGVGIFFSNQYYAASFWTDDVTECCCTGRFARWESKKEPIAAQEKVIEQSATAQEVKKQQQKYRRIDIGEIRTLPKKNWYLCNNSFLLHGFFQYNYLIIKEAEEEKKMYLGVPGYYERQEKIMAIMFGFTDFEPEKKEEPTKEGTFGYWLCQLVC